MEGKWLKWRKQNVPEKLLGRIRRGWKDNSNMSWSMKTTYNEI
jgi:hypothetical protein